VKSGFFLDVVISKSSSVIKLFSGKDESLLIWRDSFFVLDLLFDVFNGVRRFNFKCDGFSCESLNKDLHSTSESEDKVKSRFFLDVVVSKSSAIVKLFTGEDKSLLIWRDTFFILDFLLDVFNRVRWFNFKSDGFSSKGLDKDLHSTSKSED